MSKLQTREQGKKIVKTSKGVLHGLYINGNHTYQVTNSGKGTKMSTIHENLTKFARKQ